MSWDAVLEKSTLGGGDGIRTHGLYIANVALCQLSYTPEGATTLAPARLDQRARAYSSSE